MQRLSVSLRLYSRRVAVRSTTAYTSNLTPARLPINYSKFQILSSSPFSTHIDNESEIHQEDDTHSVPFSQPKHLPPWLNVNIPVETRVDEIMNTPRQLHPADFTDRGMEQLLIDCCKMQSIEGMEKAQNVLIKLLEEKDRHQEQQTIVFLPQGCFEKVLYGWTTLASEQCCAEVQTGMRNILDMALSTAKQDIDYFDRLVLPQARIEASQRLESAKPTISIFNTYLFGLSEVSPYVPKASLDAEALLQLMMEYNRIFGWHVKPTSKSFGLVLKAYSKSDRRSAGERVFTVLQKMHNMHETEKQLYFDQYHIEYDTEKPHSNRRRIVTPDAIAYSLAMSTVLQHVPSRANELLQLARNAHISNIPVLDARFFVVSLKAISRVIEKERNARIRIQCAMLGGKFLNMMKEFIESTPSTTKDTNSLLEGNEAEKSDSLVVAHNIYLDAWSRSYCVEAAPTCEEMLRNMISDKAYPSPDTVSFNAVLYGK